MLTYDQNSARLRKFVWQRRAKAMTEITGAQVRMARASLRWSIAELAERANVGISTVQAIEAAREFGFDVVGAMCLVEREEAGGRESVGDAAAPAPFVAVFTATEVREEHVALSRQPSAVR